MNFAVPLLVAYVAATNITLIALRSGDSRVHLKPLGVVEELSGEHVAINTGLPTTFDLNPKGALFKEGTSEVVTLDNDSSLVLSEARGSGPWSLVGGSNGSVQSLRWMGGNPYVICLDNNKLYVDESPPDCSTVVGVDVGASATNVSTNHLGDRYWYTAIESGSPSVHLHPLLNVDNQVKIQQEGIHGDQLSLVYNGGSVQYGSASFLGVDETGKLLISSHSSPEYYNSEFSIQALSGPAAKTELTVVRSEANGTTKGFYACPDDNWIVKVNGDCSDAIPFSFIGFS